MGSQLSGFWGEGVNTHGPGPGNGREGSKREQKTGKVCPPHPDRRHPEHRSALPPYSIPSLPLENMTISTVVAHCASGLKCSWKGEVLLPLCILSNCVG